MINVFAYFLAFIFICAFLAIMVTILHYFTHFLFWLMDVIFDPFLLNKLDK